MVLVIAFFSATSAHASFEKAMEAYSAGRFEEAKTAFETMAEIGDSASLFNLGVMYFRGEAVKSDLVRAYVLMKIANEAAPEERLLKTEKLLLAKLDETQLKAAENLYEELVQVYGTESILSNILPKLLDDEDCPPEIVPLYRAPPVYPRAELSQGRMGMVHVEHIISPEGYAREVSIAASTSRGFSKAALRAVSKYRYEPPANKKPALKRMLLSFQINMNSSSELNNKPFIRELNDLESKAQKGDAAAQFLFARGLNTYRIFEDYIPDQDFQHRTANEWYTKSASAGLVNAQYEIGRNMLAGRGCEIDREGGFKWIKAAAIGGFSPAQRFLAMSELSNIASAGKEPDSIVSWLKNAAQDELYGYPAKLLLAWEMVASSEKRNWNADEALKLLDNTPNTYYDGLRVLETEAAAWALKGNYKKAIKLQGKGLKLAIKNDWDIPKVVERLEMYKKEQFYIGTYY